MIVRNKTYFLRGLFILSLIFFMSSCDNTELDPPVLSGQQDMEILVGSDMPDFLAGIELTNATLEDVSVDTSLVDVNTVGSYQVVYTVFSDLENQVQYDITLRVVDYPILHTPVISGVENRTYVIGDPYPDFMNNVTALDNEYGNITARIVVNSDNVDMYTPGIYDIVYSVENIDGYSATKTATVEVVYDTAMVTLPEKFIIVRYNGLFGLHSITGDELVPIEYDRIEYVGDDMLYLSKNDMSYYFNSDTGEYFQYDYQPMTPFIDGLTLVRNELNLMGYMDQEGNIAIPFIYSSADPFYNGLAEVYMGGNVGIIDTEGNVIIDIMYENIRPFIEDTFATRLYGEYKIFTSENEFIMDIDDYTNSTYMNEDGSVIYRLKINSESVLFNDEFEVISDDLDYWNFSQVSDEVYYNYNSYSEGNLYTIIQDEIELVVEGILDYEIDGEDMFFTTEDGIGIFNLNNKTVEVEPQYVSIERYQDSDNLYIVENSAGYLGVITSLDHVQFGFENEAVSFWAFHDTPFIQYRDIDGNTGLLQENGLKLTYDVYESIGPFEDGYANVAHKDTGLMGYIDETGAVRVPLHLYEAYIFYNGYAIVKDVDEVAGYRVLNTDLQYITSTRYSMIGGFSNDRALVLTESLKYGYIDTTGAEIIPPTYDGTYGFTYGYAKVLYDALDNSSWGLIDVDGNVVIPGDYNYVGTVFEGMVQVKDDTGNTGYYNLDGELIIPINIDPHYGFDYSNGRVVMYHYDLGAEREYIVYDTDGTVIIDYTSNVISTYSDGLAKFTNPDTNETGFYDLNGEIAFISDYSIVYDFSGGLAPFYDPSVSSYGYMDKTGAVVIEPIYTNFTFFTDDSPYAIAQFQYGEYYNWTIITKDGEQLFSSLYNIMPGTGGYYASNPYGVSPSFEIKQEGDKLITSIVDDSFEYTKVYDQGWSVWHGDNLVVPNLYDDITYLEEEMFLIIKDGHKGLYDMVGNLILEPEFDGIEITPESGYIKVVVNGNRGIYSLTGEEIIAPIYDEVYYDSFNELFIVINWHNYGLYTFEGELILEVQYSSISVISKDMDFILF